MKNSGEGIRTPDPTDMSRLLYHLSYAAIAVFEYTKHYMECQPGLTLPAERLNFFLTAQILPCTLII